MYRVDKTPACSPMTTPIKICFSVCTEQSVWIACWSRCEDNNLDAALDIWTSQLHNSPAVTISYWNKWTPGFHALWPTWGFHRIQLPSTKMCCSIEGFSVVSETCGRFCQESNFGGQLCQLFVLPTQTVGLQEGYIICPTSANCVPPCKGHINLKTGAREHLFGCHGN